MAAIAGGALMAGCTATSTSNAERDYGGSNIEQVPSPERPPPVVETLEDGSKRIVLDDRHFTYVVVDVAEDGADADGVDTEENDGDSDK